MHWPLRGAALVAVVIALAVCRGASGDASRTALAPWTDPTPHRIRFVTVEPGVSLEMLDWGGHGPSIVFLSGLEDVAHGFDDFAPRFADRFHVLGVTRRGYGASSQPASGYDLATRVADLRTVLDSLRLARVVLIGHSIAGDELTAFAAGYPDRVDALVYLDAAYDHSAVARFLKDNVPQPPLAADSASPEAFQNYVQRVYGMRIPEAGIRAITVFGPTGKVERNVTPDAIDSLMIAGCGHPDYPRVHVPALAIYAIIDSAPQIFPRWDSLGDSGRAKGRRFTAELQEWARGERARYRRGLRGGQVLELHGANHYVYFSNEREVASAIRAFLSENTQRVNH